MGSRPVPISIMAELQKYVSGLPPRQDVILKRCFNKSQWDKVPQKVRLADFTFNDLRKSFFEQMLVDFYQTLPTFVVLTFL
jgi:hypothetical protein